MYDPLEFDLPWKARNRSEASLLAELAAETHREQREAQAASSRRRAPTTWAVVDLLNELYRAHDFPALDGILGPAKCEKFCKVLAKYQRVALHGTEISADDACRLALWAWDFQLHEEQMVMLGQRIERDAETRMGASSSAA